MKLITSLGTNTYKEATYVWGEKQCRTNMFTDAVVKWLKPQTVLVLLTKEAEDTNWPILREKLNRHRVAVQTLRIPDGRNEAEVWEIFDAVTQQIHEEERLVIDITHAFRSLQFVLFVVSAFLRAVKRVEIQHVLYGLHQQGQSSDTPSPVMDLRLMLDLLDWMEGVRRFQELGDARFIGETLQRTQDDIYRKDATTEGSKPTTLKTAGKELLALSDSLQALRVVDVMRSARKLVSITEKAIHEAQIWVKPFALLIDRVRQMAVQLAHEKPDELNFDTLEKQMHTVRALVQYRQFVQALLLQREWLLNYVMWRINREKNWLHHDSRREVENFLNQGVKAVEDKQDPNLSALDKYMGQDEIRDVVQLWSKIVDPRNDFAHCGMRQHTQTPDDLRQKATEFAQQLKNLLESAKAQF
ncbi:MAG: TIGR02221 family CRISPR-associated protein [Chthonomonadetes bacterium]|nr:TIGR02221 family CRISPR-associated protein [Chthonomonadetes bacterium]